MMTPRIAARRFVDMILRHTFGDMLTLVDRYRDEDQRVVAKHHAAYARVEAAVRRQQRSRTIDVGKRHAAVVRLISTLPADVQRRLHASFEAFDAATVDHLIVTQQTAYLIGVEIGRSLPKGGEE